MADALIEESRVSAIIDDPEWDKLVGEYADECSIAGMPKFKVDRGMYEQAEASGSLLVLSIRDKGKLVGFATAFISVLPHYSQRCVTVESMFVTQEYRGAVGHKIISALEYMGRLKGCMAIFLSSPNGGKLSKFAPKVGYTPTNIVYFKALRNE